MIIKFLIKLLKTPSLYLYVFLIFIPIRSVLAGMTDFRFPRVVSVVHYKPDRDQHTTETWTATINSNTFSVNDISDNNGASMDSPIINSRGLNPDHVTCNSGCTLKAYMNVGVGVYSTHAMYTRDLPAVSAVIYSTTTWRDLLKSGASTTFPSATVKIVVSQSGEFSDWHNIILNSQVNYKIPQICIGVAFMGADGKPFGGNQFGDCKMSSDSGSGSGSGSDSGCSLGSKGLDFSFGTLTPKSAIGTGIVKTLSINCSQKSSATIKMVNATTPLGLDPLRGKVSLDYKYNGSSISLPASSSNHTVRVLLVRDDPDLDIPTGNFKGSEVVTLTFD